MILSLLTMEGTTLTNELLRQFGYDITTATSSAFVQQRKKFFQVLLKNFFMILFYKYKYIYKKQGECAPFKLICWKYWIAWVF